MDRQAGCFSAYYQFINNASSLIAVLITSLLFYAFSMTLLLPSGFFILSEAQSKKKNKIENKTQ